MFLVLRNHIQINFILPYFYKLKLIYSNLKRNETLEKSQSSNFRQFIATLLLKKRVLQNFSQNHLQNKFKVQNCMDLYRKEYDKSMIVVLEDLREYKHSQKDQSFTDAYTLSGLQLLKLELELQNTWQHIDWGPANDCLERMDYGSRCQNDWITKPLRVCRCYEGSNNNADNDSNIIKSLLISSQNSVNIRENSCRNQKFNRMLHKTCSHSCRGHTKMKVGVNPLEQLLYGNIQENWANITEAIKLLIIFRNDRLLLTQSKQCYHQGNSSGKHHPYLSSRDEDENTPLLYAGRRLLKEKAFSKACVLSELLIQAGSDVNAANVEGRTLLTYSVQYFDDSFELTRLLINSGATVWPLNVEVGSSESVDVINENQNSNQFLSHSKPPSDVTNVFSLNKNKKEVLYFGPQIREVNTCERNSAFTWFLRSIIRCRKLNSNVEKTLGILCEIMGENPERMHSHVMRTMFRHAKCFKVLGPVFYQLKSSMMPYWRQPKDLKYLCRKEIRKLLGSDRLRTGIKLLGLPKKIVNYILLE